MYKPMNPNFSNMKWGFLGCLLQGFVNVMIGIYGPIHSSETCHYKETALWTTKEHPAIISVFKKARKYNTKYSYKTNGLLVLG